MAMSGQAVTENLGTTYWFLYKLELLDVTNQYQTAFTSDIQSGKIANKILM